MFHVIKRTKSKNLPNSINNECRTQNKLIFLFEISQAKKFRDPTSQLWFNNLIFIICVQSLQHVKIHLAQHERFIATHMNTWISCIQWRRVYMAAENSTIFMWSHNDSLLLHNQLVFSFIQIESVFYDYNCFFFVFDKLYTTLEQ